MPGTLLYGSLWGTQGLCDVPQGPSLWAESHTPALPRAAYPKGPLIRTYLFSPACSPPSTCSHTHIWMLTCTHRHAHSHTCTHMHTHTLVLTLVHTHKYTHAHTHTHAHSHYAHIRPEHSRMRTRSVSRNRKGNKRMQEKKRKTRDRKSQDSPGTNRQAGKGGRQRDCGGDHATEGASALSLGILACKMGLLTQSGGGRWRRRSAHLSWRLPHDQGGERGRRGGRHAKPGCSKREEGLLPEPGQLSSLCGSHDVYPVGRGW